MSFLQLQINPQVDDLDAVISRAAPNELLSVIYNSPTSVTLNFGPLASPSTAAPTGPLRLALPPRRH